MNKPLAKSLHTVTVLVRVAQGLFDRGIAQDKTEALGKAIAMLGLIDQAANDEYNLVGQALKQMNK
jgi:hypothetical protein